MTFYVVMHEALPHGILVVCLCGWLCQYVCRCAVCAVRSSGPVYVDIDTYASNLLDVGMILYGALAFLALMAAPALYTPALQSGWSALLVQLTMTGHVSMTALLAKFEGGALRQRNRVMCCHSAITHAAQQAISLKICNQGRAQPSAERYCNLHETVSIFSKADDHVIPGAIPASTV